MRCDFLESVHKTLSFGAFQRRYPVFRSMAMEGETQHVGLSVADSLSSDNVTADLVSTIILLFTLLDGVIDTRVPGMEGESFKARYQNLPQNSDSEIIFSQLYRLSSILRNCAVHAKTALVSENGFVTADFLGHRNRRFALTITNYGFDLLASAALIASKEATDLHPYIAGLLRSYYDDIEREISNLIDLFASNLPSVGGLRIKRHVRYKLRNPEIKVVGNMLRVEKVEIPESAYGYGIDYLIQQGNDVLQIPEDAFSNDS